MVEEQMWKRARLQAGALFDVPDLQIAFALYRLADYAWQKGSINQGTYYEQIILTLLFLLACANYFFQQASYYALLALETCEQLQKRNTALYMFLLVTSYFYITRDPKTFFEKLTPVHQLLTTSTTTTTTPLVKTPNPRFTEIIDEENEPEFAEANNDNTRKRKTTPKNKMEEKEKRKNNKRVKCKYVHEQEKERENKEEEEEEEGVELDRVIVETMAFSGIIYAQAIQQSRDPSALRTSVQFLSTLGSRWELVERVFTRPQRLKMGAVLSSVLCFLYEAMGNTAAAEQEALTYVDILSDPLFRYLSVLPEGVLNVMKILEATGNTFALHTLVRAVKDRNNGTFLDAAILAPYKAWLHKY